MSREPAKTDDTDSALGNVGKEEPRQEDSNLNEVLVTVSYSIRFRCNYCERSYPEMNGLRIHWQTHSECKLIECTHCQVSFRNFKDFVVHFKLHPEKDMKCSKCSKVYQKSPVTFGKHQDTHNFVKYFQCDSCDYNTKKRNHVKKHVKTHKGRYKCDICLKTFRFKNELKEHLRHRCQDKYVECTICKNNFESVRKLEVHFRFNVTCRNKITHQSEQPEVARTPPSSVPSSSGAGTLSGPANPLGEGTISTSGQQTSSSPATGERSQHKKSYKRFKKT